MKPDKHGPSPARSGPRRDLQVQVTLEHASQLQSYYSKNIGGNGILLEVAEYLPLGDEVNLTFQIPGRVDKIELVAKVVRHHQIVGLDDEFNTKKLKGIGLQFINVSDDDRKMIEQFIAGKGVTLEA